MTVVPPPAVEAAPATGIIAVVWRAGRVLLVRRGKAPREGEWAFPGGRLELGESLAAGALRELREETGLTADDMPEPFTAVDVIEHAPDGRLDHHFVLVALLVRGARGVAHAASDAAEVGWFAPDALPCPAVPDLDRVVALSLRHLAQAA